jgi:uncharacterized membrane protein YvbJ
MATCPKCGATIEEDYEFCPSCGASIATRKKKQFAEESYVREGDVCFGEGKRRDWSGLVSFGIFLIIVALFSQ